MSDRNVFGGLTLVILVILLGFTGLLIEPVLFLAFIAMLGYYLYRNERRLMMLEAAAAARPAQPAKKPESA